MTALLPKGYISLRRAAAIVELALYAGKADPEAVQRLKAVGFDVGDRDAQHDAIAKLWDAVDCDQLDAFAIGGVPRQIST
jgi:hypothetical protein